MGDVFKEKYLISHKHMSKMLLVYFNCTVFPQFIYIFYVKHLENHILLIILKLRENLLIHSQFLTLTSVVTLTFEHFDPNVVSSLKEPIEIVV